MSNPPPKRAPDDLLQNGPLKRRDYFKKLTDSLYFLWVGWTKHQSNVLPPTTEGTSSAYTASIGTPSFEDGRRYHILPHTDNAQGIVTVEPANGPAVNVKLRDGTNPWAGAMQQGVPSELLFDSADAILLNPQGPCIAQYQHQEAANNGGTFTAGALRTRPITHEVRDNGGIGSLSSNRITLVPGTYEVTAWACAFAVTDHAITFFNITDSTRDIEGVNAYAGDGATDGGNTGSIARLSGTITIAGNKTFELQHQSNQTQAADGFGSAAGFLDRDEIYADIVIERILPIT